MHTWKSPLPSVSASKRYRQSGSKRRAAHSPLSLSLSLALCADVTLSREAQRSAVISINKTFFPLLLKVSPIILSTPQQISLTLHLTYLCKIKSCQVIADNRPFYVYLGI